MKFRPGMIDYIWYVGERFHQQEKTPGDGTVLIATCWYCSFFLPLLSVVNKFGIPWIIKVFGSVLLIVIPFVFCRIRYDKERKELIGLRYRDKKQWGKCLLAIWGVLIIIAVAEFVVLTKTGFWRIGA